MKKCLILFLLFISSFSWSQAAIDNDLKTYLSNNGTLGYYAQVVDKMFEFLKQEYKDQQVPEALWTELTSVKPEALNDITQSIIQSYKSHFTNEELTNMLAYYNSEASKKANSGLVLSEDEQQKRDAFLDSALSKKINESSASLNNVIKNLTQEWSMQLF
ncbi:MAG: DUF2059 domain-containing protein, partial [Flavobacteriaceae bacterium]|nr:DUF2059 domain-containing protein [Flavobacteriaceae bacterium]